MLQSLTTAQLREYLKSSLLFDGLPAAVADPLAAAFHQRHFRAGALVTIEDQTSSVISVIAQGTAKVSRSRATRTTLLNIIGPGEVIGEISFLDGAGHSADVVTLEETTVMWIERQIFAEFLQGHPAMYRNLGRIVTQRLRLASSRLEALASLDVPGRVAFQLLAFSKVYGRQTEAGLLIPLVLTQTDFAELIGAARTRVNQALASMRRQNLLTIDTNHHITLKDPAALERKFVIF